MLILFDFKCEECDTIDEYVVPAHTHAVTCKVCGSHSKRMISPVRSKLDGLDAGFPDAYDKWTRDHIKRGGDSQETVDESRNQ